MNAAKLTILGILISALVIMWLPESWISTARHTHYRILYSIGILLAIFILPAFFSVFSEFSKEPKAKPR